MQVQEMAEHILEQKFLSNTFLDWIIAGCLLAASFVVLFALRHFISKKLEKIAPRSASTLDDLALALIKKTKKFFILALSIFIGVQVLFIPAGADKLVRSIFIVILLIQVWFWGAELLNALLRAIVRRDRTLAGSDSAIEGTLPAIEFVAKLALFTVILLLALDNFGFNVTTLVASLGIGGIAVALALQNILGDLFASFSILFDKPFQVGDFIIVGQQMGSVEKIGLKTTRVRSLSGEQLIFSNGDLLGSRIQNYKRMAQRRVVFSMNFVYSTPLDKLRKIPQMIKETIESMDKTKFDRAHFKSFGTHSLEFEVVYFVLSADFNIYMDIQQEINLILFEKFSAMGIEFALPVQTVFLEKTDSLVESLKNVGT